MSRSPPTSQASQLEGEQFPFMAQLNRELMTPISVSTSNGTLQVLEETREADCSQHDHLTMVFVVKITPHQSQSIALKSTVSLKPMSFSASHPSRSPLMRVLLVLTLSTGSGTGQLFTRTAMSKLTRATPHAWTSISSPNLSPMPVHTIRHRQLELP